MLETELGFIMSASIVSTWIQNKIPVSLHEVTMTGTSFLLQGNDVAVFIRAPS